MESAGRARNAADAAFTAPFQACENQGIAAGWEDEYFTGLDCQWLDITDVKIDGESETFQLAMQVNPLKLLCEGVPEPGKYVPALDEDGLPIMGPDGRPELKQACKTDSELYKNDKVAVDVVIPKTGGAVTTACATIDFGPLRDCGWTMAAPRTCDPGKQVWTPGGEITRVRAGGTPCRHDESLAEAVSAFAPFTCPASGKYVVLSGPYLAK